MMQSIEVESTPSLDLPPALRLDPRQTYQSFPQDLPPVEELYSSKLATVQHVRIARHTLREIIYNYTQEVSSSGGEEKEEGYLDYLRWKQRIFTQYYNVCGDEGGEQPSNLWVFDTCNLLELFTRMKDFLTVLGPLVKKKHGKETSLVKIEGFCLLEDIEQLLGELVNAAFPYRLIQGNPCLFKDLLQEAQLFQKYYDIDRQQEERFKVQASSFLVHSIIELGYQIEAKTKWLEQTSAKQNSALKDVIQQVKEANLISQYKVVLFYFQTVSHYRLFLSEPMRPTLKYLREFYENEPLVKMTPQQFQEIRSEPSAKNIPSEVVFCVHQHIITAMQHIVESGEQTVQVIASFLSQLSQMLEKWFILNKSNPGKALFQNFVAIWKIIRQLSPSQLSLKQESLYPRLKQYVEFLGNSLIDFHVGLMSKIISNDEELTYELLTSQTIMTTLLSQQQKIKASIEEFTPLLELGLSLSKMMKKTDKLEFIEGVLGQVNQRGRVELKRQPLKESKLKVKMVSSSIDAILEVEFEHESFQFIKPYLKEFKHILILLDVLKAIIHQNISLSQHQQHTQLQQVAHYFSQARPDCVLYELKAQILLFIALFKLGYHTPTCKQEGRVINLRNHIINLYSKLYNNTRASTILLSRISVDLLQRKSSSEQYYIFDPKSGETPNSKSGVWPVEGSEDQSCVELGASEGLLERIKRFIQNKSSSLAQIESSCKAYLLNLVNLLQSELFLQEKKHEEDCAAILTRHYTEHIRVSLDFPLDRYEQAGNLLAMEGLFYNQQYQSAWKIMAKEIANPSFSEFLEQLTRSVNNSHLLRLVRVHSVFEKMSHLFFDKENSDKNIDELMSMVNANTDYSISRKAVSSLYEICCEQRRVLELEQFFERAKSGQHSGNSNSFQPYPCSLSKLAVEVMKSSSGNKETLLIKITDRHKIRFRAIKNQMEKYLLLNTPGLSRVLQVRQTQGELWIYVESNPSCILAPHSQKSVLRVATRDFVQNDTEKLLRNFASTLIQAYHLFTFDNQSQEIDLRQINLNQRENSFNINPYLMFIEGLVRGAQKKQSKSVVFMNRRALGSILEDVLKALRGNCGPHFLSNFSYLVKKLRNFSYIPCKYSGLLEMPLFMTLHEKQMFIVYFDNKMSEMCDEFFNQERKLRKEKRMEELQKLRSNFMKDLTFRNHRYNFSLSGVVERRMVDLNICQKTNLTKLDWLTEHKQLKISYDLPTTDKHEVKQYVYSLNFMMKCLRGAIAHKMEQSDHFILSFNQEYPQLIDFLYSHKHLLTLNYQQVMARKTSWLLHYFSPSPENIVKKIKKFLEEKKPVSESDLQQQALTKLRAYCWEYEQSVFKKLKQAKVKCDRCNNFLKIALSCGTLIDLLGSLSKAVEKNQQLVGADHSYHDCFLAATFKYHRQIKVFGERVKESEVKNYLTLNWWFFLQSSFPSLLEMLNRIRYIL